MKISMYSLVRGSVWSFVAASALMMTTSFYALSQREFVVFAILLLGSLPVASAASRFLRNNRSFLQTLRLISTCFIGSLFAGPMFGGYFWLLAPFAVPGALVIFYADEFEEYRDQNPHLTTPANLILMEMRLALPLWGLWGAMMALLGVGQVTVQKFVPGAMLLAVGAYIMWSAYHGFRRTHNAASAVRASVVILILLLLPFLGTELKMFISWSQAQEGGYMIPAFLLFPLVIGGYLFFNISIYAQADGEYHDRPKAGAVRLASQKHRRALSNREAPEAE